MNRSIKVRIWDKKYNLFQDEPDCRWQLSESGELYNSENDEYHDDSGRFIINQYTG